MLVVAGELFPDVSEPLFVPDPMTGELPLPMTVRVPRLGPTLGLGPTAIGDLVAVRSVNSCNEALEVGPAEDVCTTITDLDAGRSGEARVGPRVIEGLGTRRSAKACEDLMGGSIAGGFCEDIEGPDTARACENLCGPGGT
jgi:hypothetical protein